MKKLEVWKVVECEGAFYTCRSARGEKRDFLKLDVPVKLIKEDKILVVNDNGNNSIYKGFHKEAIEFWSIVQIEGEFVTVENSTSQKQELLKSNFTELPIVGNYAVMKKFADGPYSPIGEVSRSFYTDSEEVEKIKSFLH